MKKHHLLGVALVALAIAPAAQASQTWKSDQSISGTSGSSTVNAPWSILSRSGSNCDQGTPTALTTEFVNGSVSPELAGKGGATWPAVLKNVSSTTNVHGMIIPLNRIWMHPGGGAAEACVMLRFTVPSNQPANRMYMIHANFMGAYPKPNASPPQPGHPGGVGPMAGVKGMIRVTKSGVNTQVGLQIDTATIGGGTAGGARVLNPGDTIDFAVWYKGDYGYDSTLLEGAIVRVN